MSCNGGLGFAAVEEVTIVEVVEVDVVETELAFDAMVEAESKLITRQDIQAVLQPVAIQDLDKKSSSWAADMCL